MLKEFKGVYDTMKAYARDLKKDSIEQLEMFPRIKDWDVYIFIKFKCPFDCDGHAVLSSMDIASKNIKCVKCQRRIDIGRLRKK